MSRGTDRLRRVLEPVGLTAAALSLFGFGFFGGAVTGTWLATPSTCEGQTAEYDTRFGPHLEMTANPAVST